MTIRPRGNKFQVDVFWDGKRVRKTADTKVDAKTLEKNLLAELKAGLIGGAEKPSDGKTLREIFLITKNLYWRGAKDERGSTATAEAVLEILGDSTPINSISAEDIGDLILKLESKGNSNATINRKLAALSKLFTVASERSLVAKVPKIPFRKEAKHRIRWVTDQEEVTMLSFLEHINLLDMRDFVIVALDTGFRESELLNFHVRDYQNGMLHIWESKNTEARAIPATDRVKDIIENRVKRGFKKVFENLSLHDLRWSWQKLRTHMKLTDDLQFVIHCLRHTCCSRLVQRKIPLKVVKDWMGHKSLNTTLRYAHLCPSNLEDAMQTLNKPVVYPVSQASIFRQNNIVNSIY